jgi:hypothetical protein
VETDTQSAAENAEGQIVSHTARLTAGAVYDVYDCATHAGGVQGAVMRPRLQFSEAMRQPHGHKTRRRNV